MKKFSNSIQSLNLSMNHIEKSFSLSSATTISSVEPNLFKEWVYILLICLYCTYKLIVF